MSLCASSSTSSIFAGRELPLIHLQQWNRASIKGPQRDGRRAAPALRAVRREDDLQRLEVAVPSDQRPVNELGQLKASSLYSWVSCEKASLVASRPLILLSSSRMSSRSSLSASIPLPRRPSVPTWCSFLNFRQPWSFQSMSNARRCCLAALSLCWVAP
jgi:hypothetical protein